MSWYEFVLFAHLATATIWVGGGGMIQILVRHGLKAKLAAASAEPVREPV